MNPSARNSSAGGRLGGFLTRHSLTRATKSVKRRRRTRPNPLLGTVRFFQELARNTSRSSPGTFCELFFREASRLLQRLSLGGRVSQADWLATLRDVRVTLKAEAHSAEPHDLNPARDGEGRRGHPWATAFSEKRMRVADFDRRRAPATERVQAGAA